MGQGSGDDFQEDMGCRVPVIVHIEFDHHTVDATDNGLVILVEGELYIGFPELDLYLTTRRAGVQEPGIDFYRELACGGCDPDLVDEGGIAPGKEAVLRGSVGIVPA